MGNQTGAGGQNGTTKADAGSADRPSQPPGGDLGGADGSTLGNPGFGGFPGDEAPSCSVLATQYANTVAGAQACDVSGSGQCQQLVSATLSNCPTCMTYVNNAGIVHAIQFDWMDRGCATPPTQSCPPPNCPQLTGGQCVASSGGGTCSSN
jgi:hypothetical protein